MSSYQKTNPLIWTGRKSEQQLYLHEKVLLATLEVPHPDFSKRKIALLGYACDEGVRRNEGRVGAAEGPDAIRRQLGKMPNHLADTTLFIDAGTVRCWHSNMEEAQEILAEKVAQLLKSKTFPILLGGGHDIAYGHYMGIKKFLGKEKTIGSINFDAHFDLRNSAKATSSGTPFYQIAKAAENEKTPFKYLCLGIREDANDRVLFKTANSLGVRYITNQEFSRSNAKHVVPLVLDFIREVDYIYTTIDLDGFSSAFAPGVSAASPMGFAPPIVLEILQIILDSKKLIGFDVAEMNPNYDSDNQTAKLAASLVHFVMHKD